MIRYSPWLTSKQHLSFMINLYPFLKSNSVKGGLGNKINASQLYLFDKADASDINNVLDGDDNDDDSLINLNMYIDLFASNDSNNTRSSMFGGISNSNN